MELGLSQADAAKRLNVSRSDSATLGSIPIRRFCVQLTCFRPTTSYNTCRRPFSALSARRRRTTTVPQLVADHFQASGRRISATTVRNRLHNAGLYARRPVVASTDLREQRTRYHQSNTVERHSYRGGGILVWAGISLGGHTDLHEFHGGTVTGLRYRDETLDPYVRPYAAAIGNDFILMDDNARPHRGRIVEEYLEDHGRNPANGMASVFTRHEFNRARMEYSKQMNCWPPAIPENSLRTGKWDRIPSSPH
ncbi:transposable element Tcb2 transposase [Trichonephila clavipes]|nr:transposable element Tcb2 transposase [Trichonephila clavipes]